MKILANVYFYQSERKALNCEKRMTYILYYLLSCLSMKIALQSGRLPSNKHFFDINRFMHYRTYYDCPLNRSEKKKI